MRKRKSTNKSSMATVAARKPRQKKKPKISRRKQNESTLGCNGKKKKKASTRPTTLQDENGQDVWIATATLADIARTRRTKKPPFSKNRIYLYNVPAANQRHECYERAAAAWQDMEQSLLPKYGNRSWQVRVSITDPTPSSSSSSKATKKTALPYFVFGKRTGLLELAAWPHLLLKIPNAPRFPGFDQKVKNVPSDAAKKQPKKQQPQQEEEVEEEAHIEEEEEEDPQQEEEVEEESHIEEEEEEEEEAASDAEEEEQRSEVASEDGDGQSQGGEEEDSDNQEEEESEESEGDDDESSDDDEEEEEELLDHDIADLQNERCVTPLSTLAWELRMQVPLPNITIKWISPLLESFTSRTSAWDRAVQLARNEVFLDRTLLGLDTTTGKQVPLGVSNNKNESSDNNGKKNSKSSVMASNCSVISKRVALKAGKLRFERDGLWVVGQEEEWQQRRWNNEMETTSTSTADEDKESSTSPASSGDGGGDSGGASTKRKLTALTLYLQCNRKTHQAKRVAEMTALSANTEQQVQFTLRQAETELRSMWKNELTEDERQEWGRRAAVAAAATTTATATIGDETSVMVPPSVYEQEKEEDSRKMPPGTLNTTVVATTNTTDPTTTSTTAVCVTPTSSEALEKVTAATLDGAESAASCSAARRRLVVSPEEPPMFTAVAASSSTCMDVATMLPPPSSIPSNVAPSGNMFVPSTYWRLNTEQIRLCNNAGIEHYESVMATVMARGLNRELQDGFDVLRERGRGRFDMVRQVKFVNTLPVHAFVPYFVPSFLLIPTFKRFNIFRNCPFSTPRLFGF
jgi:hypothetical protein